MKEEIYKKMREVKGKLKEGNEYEKYNEDIRERGRWERI